MLNLSERNKFGIKSLVGSLLLFIYLCLPVLAEDSKIFAIFNRHTNKLTKFYLFEEVVIPYDMIRLSNNNLLLKADNFIFELTNEPKTRIIKTLLTKVKGALICQLANKNLLILEDGVLKEITLTGKVVTCYNKKMQYINNAIDLDETRILIDTKDKPKNLEILNYQTRKVEKATHFSLNRFNKTHKGDVNVINSSDFNELERNLKSKTSLRLPPNIEDIMQINDYSYIVKEKPSKKIKIVSRNFKDMAELVGITEVFKLKQVDKNHYGVLGITGVPFEKISKEVKFNLLF